MNTDEREERLKQIRKWRQGLTRATVTDKPWLDTIDFLLSLLDSQTPMTLSPCNTPAQAFNAEREKKVAANAATRIRALCVERVGQLRSEHKPSANQDYEYGFYDALDRAEKQLQSLTLDQVQEKR